ncbi:MAG: hypothetical protein NTZ69_05885 [Bacteroidia bacterium]|nr:hypothetical protein [Bacteroidia bacterium]
MNKGEIFRSVRKTEAIHPIIFLNDIDNDFFRGGMLTSSGHFSDNVMMDPRHFKTHNLTGEKYELQFKDTHLVRVSLLKKREWAPFRKVGELTDEGIFFVEKCFETAKLVSWEEYIN